MGRSQIATAAGAVLAAFAGAAAAQRVEIDPDDIGGIVASAAGPEAGVWVIAETDDFQTTFRKIVVTDHQGRYVLPDLPEAGYELWVRGYGLVDSVPVPAAPGGSAWNAGICAASSGRS